MKAEIEQRKEFQNQAYSLQTVFYSLLAYATKSENAEISLHSNRSSY